jgi:uncharacterized membrane protein YphA (DoxX/SURF4 family)
MNELNENIYLLIRLLLCVTWVVAFIQKTVNHDIVLANWRKDNVPLVPYCLYFVLAVELVGSVMVIFDFYTWLVALGWIAFIIAVFKFTVTWGRTEHGISPLAIQVAAKNISLIGALIALIAFDKTRPDWLTQLLFS